MKKLLILSIALTMITTLFACSHSYSPTGLADGNTATSEQNTMSTGTAAPTDNAQAAPAPTPKPEQNIAYPDKTIATKSEGGTKFDLIKSAFPCKTKDDCTSTKFKNTPKTSIECTCAAACTPYVVNVIEKKAREDANNALCGPTRWYGPNCPAPDCNFVDFDGYECVEGVCAALAVGRR